MQPPFGTAPSSVSKCDSLEIIAGDIIFSDLTCDIAFLILTRNNGVPGKEGFRCYPPREGAGV